MANEWNKTALVAEFETMLRRHLRSGAAPVAACAGFDMDAASAYLEGALSGPHRASYESHLAGCAICRRHLIELARLAQAAPRFEVQPAPPPGRIPAWERWKESVKGRFDLSTWNLKWQIASATGVAFAALIAALGVQSWRRAPNQPEVVVNGASVAATPAAEPGVQALPSPTLEPPPQDAATPAAKGLIAGASEQSAIPAPAPPVRPIESPPNIAVEAPGKLLALNSKEPSEAPPAAKPSGVEARPIPPPQVSNYYMKTESPADVSGSVLSDRRKDSREQAAKESVHGPEIVTPRYRASLVESKPERRAKPQPERSRLKVQTPPEVKAWNLHEILRRSFARFTKSDSDTESERKAKPDKQEASDDEALKPMTIIIRDKTFCFEKCKGDDREKILGTWVDREYDSEKQRWNVRALKSDSEEYKRILADEPQLEEFFNHRPILIVWENRIYKVLK